MLLLKKIFLGLIAAGLIFVGGSGTQSNSLLMQGIGLAGIVAGLAVLYIFGKLVWRAMGCLPSFIIFGGITCFILYAIGAFNGGVYNVIPNIKNFIGIGSNQNQQGDDDIEVIKLVDEEAPQVTINENFSDVAVNNQNPEPISNIQQPEQDHGGVLDYVSNLFSGKNKTDSGNFNPRDYPAVYGSVQVVSGDTLLMRRHFIRLYGIDAPEIKQTCITSRGSTYYCGKEASRWLQSWLGDNEIECHVLKQNSQGNVVATCSLGEYDIGAALVSAGWAVSLPQNEIYAPYELQAQKARRGMWKGKFYKPWDWIKLQSIRPKIKINKPKTKTGKRLWDFI